MAYELHIERDEPINADEWRSAVQGLPTLLRLMPSDWTSTNPATRERISMVRNPLDTEVWFEAEQRWVPIFRVSDDDGQLAISFRAELLNDTSLQPALRHLAQRLAANIVGDEGELYDLPG